MLYKIEKKLGKKLRKLFKGIGKRSAGVELLPGIDGKVNEVCDKKSYI